MSKLFRMYERSYLKQVKSRIEEPRQFIQVILGPRQVGKTTMVNQLLSQLSTPNIYESADAKGKKILKRFLYQQSKSGSQIFKLRNRSRFWYK